jgi:hypothetical protein
MMFREHPGYRGHHTREQAAGAIANGREVRKIAGERKDAHPIGATATVLGSVYGFGLGYAYFVEWHDDLGLAVLVVAEKITEVGPEDRARETPPDR